MDEKERTEPVTKEAAEYDYSMPIACKHTTCTNLTEVHDFYSTKVRALFCFLCKNMDNQMCRECAEHHSKNMSLALNYFKKVTMGI